MGNLGATEILLILLVVVLLFVGIPELMKGIGQGMKEFKKASRLDDESDKTSTEHKEEEKK